MKPLPVKRERFVQEYLRDPNGAQAAIRAGYSPKSAKAIASELLTFPDVRAAIEDGRRKLSAELEVSARRVIEELAKIAFAPLGHLPSGMRVSDKRAALVDLGRHLRLFGGTGPLELEPNAKGEDVRAELVEMLNGVRRRMMANPSGPAEGQGHTLTSDSYDARRDQLPDHPRVDGGV